MFDRIIHEIEICLEYDATLAALALALTIPDAFSRIEYRNRKQEKRYPDWIDNYAPGIINKLNEVTIPIKNKTGRYKKLSVPSDGKIIYHIRNTLFHESTTKLTSKGAISHISLKDDGKSKYGLYVHAISSSVINNDEQNAKINYRISIRGLIDVLIESAKKYYEENVDKMEAYEKDWTIPESPHCLNIGEIDT